MPAIILSLFDGASLQFPVAALVSPDPIMNLSHFEAAFLFALFTSVVLGVVTKRNDRDRMHYGAYTFVCFLVALFGIGWAMYLGHG